MYRAILSDMASAVKGTSPQAQQYFEQSLALLSRQRARWLQSVVEWEFGIHLATRDPARAEQHLQQALQLSQSLADMPGIAAAATELAKLFLGQEDPQKAMNYARVATTTAGSSREIRRVLGARIVLVRALARTRQLDELQRAINAIESADRHTPTAAQIVDINLALAEGYATLGRHEAAFVRMQMLRKLERDLTDKKRVADMVQLRERYEVAQRESALAGLRQGHENARLQLEHETARKRNLWLAVSTLASLAVAAGLWISRVRLQQRALSSVALSDDLTGLPNRRAILATAEAALLEAQRDHQPLALAVVDLDHFKRINDTWGHAAGDRALVAFAAAARQALHPHERIGRFGGEEWLLVVPGADTSDLENLFERLRHHFCAQMIDGLPLPHECRFSMGAVHVTAGHPPLQELIREADRALYRAKDEGRDRLAVASPSSDAYKMDSLTALLNAPIDPGTVADRPPARPAQEIHA